MTQHQKVITIQKTADCQIHKAKIYMTKLCIIMLLGLWGAWSNSSVAQSQPLLPSDPFLLEQRLQTIVTDALRVAQRVNPDSERILRQRVSDAARRTRNNSALDQSVRILVIAVLAAAVEQIPQNNGIILVSESSIQEALSKVCPLYPFC